MLARTLSFGRRAEAVLRELRSEIAEVASKLADQHGEPHMDELMMAEAEVADQIARASLPNFREMIAATVVDPASACADYQRRELQRIADTLGAVEYVTMCNLANLDAALRGGLLDLIEVRLRCVGAGPTLDYADATAFLAGFETMIEKVRRRRLQ